MLAAERQKRILSEVRDRQAVRAEDLSLRFGVSVETVRRDLRQLAKMGLLERVYGGAAISLVSSTEGSFDQRRQHYANEKRAIATLGADLIENGETILIDVGTTCHEVAKSIPHSWSGRVVTNSVLVAAEMSGRSDVEVLLAGGWVRGGDLACSGQYAARVFDDYFVSLAFVASGAVHPTTGLTDYYPAEAELRRDWLQHVGRAYLLAISSKLGNIAPCLVSSLGRFDAVITDDGADAKVLEGFVNENVNVLIANTERERNSASAS